VVSKSVSHPSEQNTHYKLDKRSLRFVGLPLQHGLVQGDVDVTRRRVFQCVRDKIDADPLPRSAGDRESPVRTQGVLYVQDQDRSVVTFRAVKVLRSYAWLIEAKAGCGDGILCECTDVYAGLCVCVSGPRLGGCRACLAGQL
jgi:hypothetical protein